MISLKFTAEKIAHPELSIPRHKEPKIGGMVIDINDLVYWTFYTHIRDDIYGEENGR